MECVDEGGVMEDHGGVANGLASDDMDNVTHCSVVLHVDLDCFYAAVEHVRLGIPREKPLAVQQWRGLIAINYAARAAGITRHERADQALKKCPELQLVHVETIGEVGGSIDVPNRGQAKVSLERYRQASASVFSIFRRFSEVYEKASIDEAYLDVTAKVEEMMNQGCNWDHELGKLLENNEQGCSTMVVLDGPLVPFNSYDRRMLAGAIIADKIRASVRNELGYTCSVGIATNKLLAKIASAKNKPDRQTVIPPRAVQGLMETMPLKKMRLLGGKLGEELTQKWGFSTAGEAQALSITTLVSKFGERQGNYVWNAVRGIQADKVQPKQVPKSMLAAKSFAPTKELSDIRRWLGILSEELSVRMLRDFEQNHRHPRLLQLYYRSGGFKHAKDHSKSWSMPHSALTTLSSSSVSSQLASETVGHTKETLPEHEQQNTVDLENEDHPSFQGVGEPQVMEGYASLAEDFGEGPIEGLGFVVTEKSKTLARVLEDAAYNMFMRLDETFPCTRLALAATGFQELAAQGTKSIQHFFSTAAAGTAEKTSSPKNQKPSFREATPDKSKGNQKGILKYLHHAAGPKIDEEMNHDAAVHAKNLPEIAHNAGYEDNANQLSDAENCKPQPSIVRSLLPDTAHGDSPASNKTFSDCMASSAANLSSSGPSETSGEMPEPISDHRPLEDVDGKSFRAENHDLATEGSDDIISEKKPQSSDLRTSEQNGEVNSSNLDNIDLGKVDMKQQVRILADIQHSSAHAAKSDKQVRSRGGAHNPAKRPRQSTSGTGQQSIGKFFSAQAKPS